MKVSAGERQEDQAHAACWRSKLRLRTLEKHSGANEKISQQRRDLWKAENQYAVLKEAATKRQLSGQEKSLLAHEKETLEYKRQLADLGDKVEHQKRLNELAQQAARFEQQQSAKQAAISAKPAASATVRRSGSRKRSGFVMCTAIIRRRWRKPHLH